MGKFFWFSLLLAVLSLLIGGRIDNFRERLLASNEMVQKHLPNCVALKTLNYGSDDLTILRNGRAIISIVWGFPGNPFLRRPGKLYTIDAQNPQMEPVELRMPRHFDVNAFHPLGINVYTDPTDDTVYLFVVNYSADKRRVELFRFVEEDLSLLHLKTIKHDLLHSVNDIVAVGVDSFYATNDHYFDNHVMKAFFETFLGQPWCNVVYYSPEEVKVVSEGYYMANGINISPDRASIYVVDFLDHNVHVLDRKEDNTLAPVKIVPLGSLCDSVEVDPETGDLWFGCQPNGMKFLMLRPEDPAGSEVIRVQNIHTNRPVVTQVYADNGTVIRGTCAAAVYGGKLLIGSLSHKILCCDLL